MVAIVGARTIFAVTLTQWRDSLTSSLLLLLKTFTQTIEIDHARRKGEAGMSERDYIHIRDLPLYIDVDCYGCKRPCALSNTREVDGRHYCGACAGDFPRGAAVTEFLNDWPDATIIRL